MLKKMQKAVESEESRQDDQSTVCVQKESSLIVHFNFGKTRARKAAENTRKRVSRSASKACQNINALEEENQRLRKSETM